MMHHFRHLIIPALCLLLGFHAHAQQSRSHGYEMLMKGLEHEQAEDSKKALEAYGSVHRSDSVYERVLLQKINVLMREKQYDDAIRSAEEGIAIRGTREHFFRMNKGASLAGQKKYDEAIASHEAGAREHPALFRFHHLKALALKEKGDKEAALAQMKLNVQRFPYSQDAHVALSSLAQEEGKLAQSAMALSMAIIVRYGTDRTARLIGFLDELVVGKLDEDPQGYDLAAGSDDFTEEDLLLRNRVGMNKNYKVKPDLAFPLVRQSHLLFSTLRQRQPGDGFWDTFYVPFFQALMNANQYEGFVYHCLANSTNPKNTALADKNKAKVAAFRTWVAGYMTKTYTTFPDGADGSPLKHVFNENGDLFGVGDAELPDGKPTGTWTYFHNNGRMSAKGVFNAQGAKHGKWEHWHENGSIRRRTEWNNGTEHGLLLTYHDNGALKDSVAMKDGKAHGIYHERARSGALLAIKTFDNGVITGPAKQFYPVGSVKYELDLVDDEADGVVKGFHPDGRPMFEGTFTKGQRQGVHRSTYASGKPEDEFTYKEGKGNGPFKDYFSNGKMYREGQRTNGRETGEIKGYYIDGTLKTTINFDEQGREHGITKEYNEDGTLYVEREYKSGLMIKYRYFDRSGKVISEGTRQKGKFQLEGKWPHGTSRVKGVYLDEGAKDGVWTYFHRDGTMDAEETFVKGQLKGQSRHFDLAGRPSILYDYTVGPDAGTGPFKSYWSDGDVKAEGYMVNEELNGVRTEYWPDGRLNKVEYYVDGERDGWQQYFDPEGVLTYEEHIRDGMVWEKVLYDATGKEFHRYQVKPGDYVIEEVYANGKPYCRIPMKNGMFHGKAVWFYPDGGKEYEGEYFNGQKHGRFTGYHPNGKVQNEEQYDLGQRTGVWKSYHDNSQLRIERTFEDDRMVGLYKSFHRNGKPEQETEKVFGMDHGKRLAYSYNGELQMIRYYDHGRLVGYSYHGPDGKPVPTKDLSDGVCELESFFPNGKRSRIMKYRNGEIEGDYKEYFENGKVMEEMRFSVGDVEGDDLEYYDTGVIRERSTYVMGLVDGEHMIYRTDGKVEMRATYRSGVAHGEWVYYDDKGKVKLKLIYRNGDVVQVEK
ncbi:MAG: hypothetical protein JNM31_10955 [Flavobacteriales bacterium]|nr:hypothetical protein [Flavobacteriales bacterium]